jgi:hypothetical protein
MAETLVKPRHVSRTPPQVTSANGRQGFLGGRLRSGAERAFFVTSAPGMLVLPFPRDCTP